MSISVTEIKIPVAKNVHVGDTSLEVDLSDGRTVTVPLAWYPRLEHATAEERANWRFIGGGKGIHWSDVDEDVSVEALIEGKSSTESQASLKQWLESRENGGC